MAALAEANSFRFHISESKCLSVPLTSYSWQLLSIFSDVQVIDWNPSYHKSCEGNTFLKTTKDVGSVRASRWPNCVTARQNLRIFQSYFVSQELYRIKIVPFIYYVSISY